MGLCSGNNLVKDYEVVMMCFGLNFDTHLFVLGPVL